MFTPLKRKILSEVSEQQKMKNPTMKCKEWENVYELIGFSGSEVHAKADGWPLRIFWMYSGVDVCSHCWFRNILYVPENSKNSKYVLPKIPGSERRRCEKEVLKLSRNEFTCKTWLIFRYIVEVNLEGDLG